LKKRFLDTIQRYQDVERNYQIKYRQRIERQIRIGKLVDLDLMNVMIYYGL
jgi:syntaxin 1B/2/3